MKPSKKIILAALLLPCVSLSANQFLFAFERGIGGGSGSAGPPPTGDFAATPASAGWTVLGGANAVLLDNTTPDAFSAISEGPGSNAYRPELSDWNWGFLFFSGRNGAPAPQVFFSFTNSLGATSEGLSSFNGTMQNEWLTNASYSLDGRTFSDLESLSVFSNPRATAGISHHFAIETPSGWVVASEVFSPSTTNWGNFYLLDDPQNATWLTGFYDPVAGTLATSAAGLTEVSIAGDTPILGYGILTFTGDAVGTNDSWVRFDDYLVVAIPEPSVWAALLGLVSLALVVRRRRRV
jgi:hypothetical protein